MRVAYRELASGLAALYADPVTAAGGTPALDRLLHLGQYVLGVPGMAIAELAEGAGRIVSAVGVADWSLGRPIDPTVLSIAHLPGDPVYLIKVSDLDGIGARQLNGVTRILVHRIDVGQRTVALLGAFLPDSFPEDRSADTLGDRVDGDYRAAIRLLGATIGRLYFEQAHLPVQQPHLALDRSDRELFIAVTSHELRTPVAVIKGYADTLRDHWDSLDEQTRREAARVIGQRADELARLVDRLLAASTGSETVSLVPFDLLETLLQAATELPSDLRRRLRLKLPPRLPPALGDRASVATVLTELLTNAHKYSPGTEPVLLTAAADRATVLFQIADRGIGLPADQIHHAFERFWQGDSGDRRRYGGAGLGLYLVRKTIERQNGWVNLRHRDGGGTVAEVRLPRGDIAAQATIQ